MIFLILLAALCYLSILFTQFLVNFPIDFFGWIHIPSVVLWGSLLFLLAWLLGE